MPPENETTPAADEAAEVSLLTVDTPEQTDDATTDDDAALDPPAEGDEHADDPPADEDDGLIDFEWEGKSLRVPPELKAAAMRQADYTQKTQAVARDAEALKEERKRLEQQAERIKDVDADRVQLAIVESQIKAIDATDWDKLEDEDPEEAGRLSRLRVRIGARRDDLATKLDQKQKDLAAERQRGADEARAKAIRDSHAVLQKDIKGWSADLATKVGEFAVTSLGWSPDAVLALTDPVIVKTLHRAYVGDLAQRKLSAQNKLKAGEETPPISRPGGGGAAPNARRTTDASGDQLSMDEWVKRERERVAAKPR